MNPDGSGQTSLTDSELDDYWYWWSPDSTQIYVSSASNPNGDILQWTAVILNVDGSGATPIQVGWSLSWR